MTTYTPERHTFERLNLSQALERSEEHLGAMQTRRSVRRFSSDPIPRALIENALRVATSAPSGANQQPWTFVAVFNEHLKQRVRKAAEQEEELLYRERASDEYLRAIEPIGTTAAKPHITEAPCLLVVFEQPWRWEDGEKRKHYYVRESVGIAVGFLLTALHRSGLATLTHAPSPMGFLREILERPENERPFLLIPTGYPATNADVPTLTKKSYDEAVVIA